MNKIIGAQVYGLKSEFERDFAGTLAQIAEMGYQAIEPLVVPIEEQGPIPMDIWSLTVTKKAMAVLNQLGMTMPSMHIGAALGSPEQPDELIAEALKSIHQLTGAKYYVFSGMFGDAEGARRCGEALGNIARLVGPEGICVVYHNHDDEWNVLDIDGENVRAMDYFYRFAGDEVLLELDLGWTALACDELEVMEKYRNQIALLHCRDFYPAAFSGKYTRADMPAELFAPVGLGRVRVRQAMEMAEVCPNFAGMYIVEQERSAYSMLADMDASVRTMKRWLEKG